MSSDTINAHMNFSTTCFNDAWELLDRANRSEDDNQRMIHLAHASLYHWLQRPDVTDQNIAIGYWLLARVYATLRQPVPAFINAEQALRYSENLPAFYQAYAHEALARAAAISGDRQRLKAHMNLAKEYLLQLDESDRNQLLDDLATIR